MRLTRSILWLAVAGAVAVLGPSAPVAADVITGENADLDAAGGVFYIPFLLGSSGSLGVGGVGQDPDFAELTGLGSSTTGEISFVLNFDLSQTVPPGDVVEPESLNLSLNFDDMDFLADIIGPTTLVEALGLTYLQDADDVPGPMDLVIDETNYMAYRATGGTDTDDAAATYLLNLVFDLGLTQDDLDELNEDLNFALQVTFGSVLTMQQDGSVIINNTSETLETSLSYNVIPEPASALLLVSGSVLVLLRRRRGP